MPLLTGNRLLFTGSGDLRGRHAKTIPVAVEQHARVLALGAIVRLDPLAPTRAIVQCFQEADRSAFRIRPVMLAHHWLDGFSSLIGVVERDGGDVMVQDVSLDDAVEQLTADEAELAIDGRCGAAGKVPGRAVVVRERRVGVLEVGDGN